MEKLEEKKQVEEGLYGTPGIYCGKYHYHYIEDNPKLCGMPDKIIYLRQRTLISFQVMFMCSLG